MEADDYILGHRNKRHAKRNLIILCIGVGLGAFAIGALIGHFATKTGCSDGPCLGSGTPEKIISEADPSITQKIIDSTSADNIRENLRKYTDYAHLAETPGDKKLTKEIFDTWMRQGLDHVTESTYDVLLSYPNTSDPNVITVEDSSGTVVFESQRTEKILDPSMNKSDVPPPFNAYSPPGDLQGELVFINHGLQEDWDYIRKNLSINVTDKIVLCKYGKAYRGDLNKFAEDNGAKGIIFYNDPADYTGWPNDTQVYPESWWLPPTGVHRGSLLLINGDPLTEGYPALAHAYRIDEKDASLPKIPAHPISYGDARELLRRMKGPTAPDAWQGGLNITYKIGPGFEDGQSLRMHVTTYNKRVNTSNVCGYISGSVEPDRYVLMGNHRDAWVFGAVDPTSATAVMMEVSRVLSHLVKEGWRPRRTLVFCSWGAEEYGLVGSYEWVEDHVKILRERAVVYLNLDLAVPGNFSLHGKAVPLLTEAMFEAAKKIETPNTAGKTLYQEWAEARPAKDADGKNLTHPGVSHLGSGSDYTAFYVFAGVSSLSFTYRQHPAWKNLGYPSYHSAYETFHLVDNYIDRGFRHSQALARLYGELIRSFADPLVLPLSVSAYSAALKDYFRDLKKGFGPLMSQNGISLDYLEAEVNEFEKATSDFDNRRGGLNTKNPIEVRMYNDQMMQLERMFLDPAGTPDRPLSKHLILAPSSSNAYAGTSFPGLVDLMANIETNPDAENQWEKVKQHLSVITFTVHAAANSMKSPPDNYF